MGLAAQNTEDTGGRFEQGVRREDDEYLRIKIVIIISKKEKREGDVMSKTRCWFFWGGEPRRDTYLAVARPSEVLAKIWIPRLLFLRFSLFYKTTHQGQSSVSNKYLLAFKLWRVR